MTESSNHPSRKEHLVYLAVALGELELAELVEVAELLTAGTTSPQARLADRTRQGGA